MINIKIRLFFLCTISLISILIFSEEPNQMTKEIISTENAPQAIGPYSQAVKAGNLMFISGQIPLNPKTGDLVSDSIEEQAKQVLNNVQSLSLIHI